jgi:type II secretory pathway component PulC
MKLVHLLVPALLLVSPSLLHAFEAPSPLHVVEAPAPSAARVTPRLVPAMRAERPVGFRVYNVGAPLAARGLRNGDLILAVDGTPCTTPLAAQQLSRRLDLAGAMLLDVERAGARFSLALR